jgi:hypothetical protein
MNTPPLPRAALAAKGGSQALKPFVANLYATRALAYKNAAQQFVDGYKQGFKEAMRPELPPAADQNGAARGQPAGGQAAHAVGMAGHRAQTDDPVQREPSLARVEQQEQGATLESQQWQQPVAVAHAGEAAKDMSNASEASEHSRVNASSSSSSSSTDVASLQDVKQAAADTAISTGTQHTHTSHVHPPESYRQQHKQQ